MSGSSLRLLGPPSGIRGEALVSMSTSKTIVVLSGDQEEVKDNHVLRGVPEFSSSKQYSPRKFFLMRTLGKDDLYINKTSVIFECPGEDFQNEPLSIKFVDSKKGKIVMGNTHNLSWILPHPS